MGDKHLLQSCVTSGSRASLAVHILDAQQKREMLEGAGEGRRMLEHEPLGLESGTVVVVSYDSRWVPLFEEAAAELRRAFGSQISEIHHVGSTAVPGLCAKPIVDILVSIPRFSVVSGLYQSSNDSDTNIAQEVRSLIATPSDAVAAQPVRTTSPWPSLPRITTG